MIHPEFALQIHAQKVDEGLRAAELRRLADDRAAPATPTHRRRRVPWVWLRPRPVGS
jgi:hypothetical protein